MNRKLEQNFEEKIRLVLVEIKSSLDDDFESMLRQQAAKGMLRSGNTISATMNMISDLTKKLYQEILSHLDSLSFHYYQDLETEVAELANKAQIKLKIESLAMFKKSTELAGNPSMYERMLPDVEAKMAKNLAVFQNNLNSKVLKIKQATYRSKIEKLLWMIEGLLTVSAIFVAGMWFKDPQGNYEPILVGLGLIMPLVYLLIKRETKKITT